MIGKQVSRSRIPDGLIRMETSTSEEKQQMIVGGDEYGKRPRINSKMEG